MIGRMGRVKAQQLPANQPRPTATEQAIDAHLTADVPMCREGDTVDRVAADLLGSDHEAVGDVVVLSDDPARPRRLVGLIPLERMLGAQRGTPVAQVIDRDPPVVSSGSDREHAAWKAVRHGETSLVVVDGHGDFVGLVPPVRLLSVLLAEHDEDLARLGGVLSSTQSARHALLEPLGPRLWHRVPWLALGLLGAALSAWFVGGFEAQLAADVRLFFFVPGVVYLADAVGTQTEALVIRGLSVGVPIRQIFRREAMTGLVVGLLLGTITYAGVIAVFADAALALTVALSLLAACSMASIVAMALPWAMSRNGRDPAFGSGPLATVVQDLLSLLIYFALAIQLL